MDALIESLPSAIVFIEGDTIVGWNTAASSLYGWPAHEVIGRSFREVLVDGSDLAEIDSVITHAEQRGRWQGNFRVKRHDGALLVSSFMATTVRVEAAAAADASRVRPHRIAWVATDVVDQHLAEQEREVLVSAQNAAARELEATVGLLEALLECAPMGIAVLDLELFWTHGNSAFAEMIGADKPPVGEHLDDLGSLPAEVVADLRRVVTTGRSTSGRRIALPPAADGSVRTIDANYFPISAGRGQPAGAGLTWTDITAAEMAEGERAQLVQRASAAQDRLALLASTSAVLMGATDVDRLLDRLARVLAPSVCDWCILEMVGRTGLVEHLAVSHLDRDAAQTLQRSLRGRAAAPSERSVIATVRRTGQAQLLAGDELVARLHDVVGTSHDQFAKLGLTSIIVVPIRTRSEFIGLLILGNAGSNRLTEDDLDLAVEIAHRGALALDRAITYRNEHALAEQLQQALLPGRIPDIPGCRIATTYSAAADAATVGGDWYDVLALGGGRVALCVGDVVGHDTAAAVGMSRLRYLIHAFATESAADAAAASDPAAILDRVDRLIYDDQTAWATCVLAILDTSTNELVWSNAGHPPMLLARDGVVRQLEATGGAMLGVKRNGDRRSNRAQLFDGDRLLFFTDGLFERRGESVDVGLGRLGDAFRAYRNQPLERMCREITLAMLRGVEQTDDVAILAAEISAG
ncbi:MAG: sensor protein [Ilumatobacteraceae bacterium]|nr:sensor protein [Ilumatobacteraceae bacterium]